MTTSLRIPYITIQDLGLVFTILIAKLKKVTRSSFKQAKKVDFSTLLKDEMLYFSLLLDDALE